MSEIKIKYHFLYKTTNLINGKYYLGMHSTFNIKDGYLGSGKILRYSIRKYGRENFNSEIIEFYDSREELANAEMELITESTLNDILCINLRKGGLGGGGIISEEHHIKMRLGSSIHQKNKWLDEDFNKKISLLSSIRLKEKWATGKLNSEMTNHKNRKVYKHTIETKEKMSLDRKNTGIGESNSQFGTCWITKDGENKKIKKDDLDMYLILNWVKGRK